MSDENDLRDVRLGGREYDGSRRKGISLLKVSRRERGRIDSDMGEQGRKKSEEEAPRGSFA